MHELVINPQHQVRPPAPAAALALRPPRFPARRCLRRWIGAARSIHGPRPASLCVGGRSADERCRWDSSAAEGAGPIQLGDGVGGGGAYAPSGDHRRGGVLPKVPAGAVPIPAPVTPWLQQHRCSVVTSSAWQPRRPYGRTRATKTPGCLCRFGSRDPQWATVATMPIATHSYCRSRRPCPTPWQTCDSAP